jgi:hypothetical protein
MGSMRHIRFLQLVLLAALAHTCQVNTVRANDETDWQPAKTRVFIVSLAQFQNGRLHAFTPSERLDGRLVELFKERGVPANQVLLVSDRAATTKNVQSQFTNFLSQSRPGETLFFLFSSHGGYDPKTGKYMFYTYDGDLPFTWAFQSIERDFKGSQAILSTDCCYSGGIADLAAKRNTPIAYACLSSTYDHQIAWSGWRFIQCLNRGLAGDPVVDLNGDRQITLEELAGYTTHYMAFAAEGKPTFKTTGGFDPKLRLGETMGQKVDRVGELLEAKSGYGWAKAEIRDTRANGFKVHYTKDTKSTNDGWLAAEALRPFRFEKFPVGATVNVQDADDAWHSAKVVEQWESLHRCRYDNPSSVPDEWFGPSRIRPSVAGSWTGRYENDVSQSDSDNLVLRQDDGDVLHGTWSGNVALKGERIGKDAFFFEAQTSNRLYRAAGRVTPERLEMDYYAHRTAGQSGSYQGWSRFVRKGDVTDTPREARAEFAGKWTGAYENSQGGSGPETLELTEQAGRLQGVWSDVSVTGERLGSASFTLTGTSGKRTYRVVGRVSQGELRLDYSATQGDDRYFGWSTLKRR